MSRLDLHQLLLDTVGPDVKVYFQPPENLKMKYPCVRYERNNVVNLNADDIIYKQDRTYQLFVIDEDPDSEIVDRISTLPTVMFSRHYVSDGLNHDVFTIVDQGGI